MAKPLLISHFLKGIADDAFQLLVFKSLTIDGLVK